jgi:ketosteroid isomerase-like protein
VSEENVEVVNRLIAAVNERDIDGYLACCTEDIQLRTPWTAIEGEYVGQDAIRRFFVDLGDVSPDFRLTIERLESVGPDRVLALMLVSATGRASGIPARTDAPTANVYDLIDGKIRRIQIYIERSEALDAVRL